jgi:hypothetical protein
MKNYKGSDYALNKYSRNIVYRFADSIREITPADFLLENPGKTEADFRGIKQESDAIYLEQDRETCRQTWKDIPFIEDMDQNLVVDPLELFLEEQDKVAARIAYALLLKSGKLTAIQERRFKARIEEGLSIREIARKEGVYIRASAKSIKAAEKLLKDFFKKSF